MAAAKGRSLSSPGVTLAIDVGNSNIKFGIHHEGSWERRFRVSTDRTKTPDEYGLTFRSLLARIGVELAQVERAVVSSVVPPLTGVISEMLEVEMKRPPVLVGPGIRTGIRIRTDNPVEVGSDIVTNAVAAYDRCRSACIIVDFGTALTFTAVNGGGDLLGVAIAPSLQLAGEALVRATSQLRLVEYAAPPSAIGRNTVQSLQSGIVFGYVGLVEGLVGRIRDELGGEAKVVSTGDHARHLLPLTASLGEFDPWLTLDGLVLISDRNA